jgi:virginiamycin B lyase
MGLERRLSAASEPHGPTIGPDGALWVALETGSAARIEV